LLGTKGYDVVVVVWIRSLHHCCTVGYSYQKYVSVEM
jgi:hypothetical protein